jgi:NAD kinase
VPRILCSHGAELTGWRVADWEVMNELALHRGAVAHLTTVDVFVDGQHLTEAVVRPAARSPARA